MSIKLGVHRNGQAKEFELIHFAKEGDVGIDIPAITPVSQTPCGEMHEIIVLRPNEQVRISTGISLDIPDGYWIAIEARSSTSARSIIVPKGVIDTGYRGELFATLINVGKETQYIRHGDRLVQIILKKNYTPDIHIEEVDVLSKTERGDTGFGSSGKSAESSR